MLKVTPELRQRQEDLGRHIVRCLSTENVDHRDAELEKYKNTDHHSQGKALLDEKHRLHKAPPTAIVPDEEKVIEAVIGAGERFERAAAKKSKLFAKFKLLAEKARARVITQKHKRASDKLNQEYSNSDGLYSSTGYRKQTKKGRKPRPPGRGIAKSNLEELRRRKAERDTLASKLKQAELQSELDTISEHLNSSHILGRTKSKIALDLKNWKSDGEANAAASDSEVQMGEPQGATNIGKRGSVQAKGETAKISKSKVTDAEQKKPQAKNVSTDSKAEIKLEKGTAKAEKGSSKNGPAQAIGKETKTLDSNKVRVDKLKREKAKAERLSKFESMMRSDNEKKL